MTHEQMPERARVQPAHVDQRNGSSTDVAAVHPDESRLKPGPDNSHLNGSPAVLRPRRPALHIAVGFVAFSAIWIPGSDYVLQALVSDVRLRADLQIAEWILYVVAANCVILLLVQSQMRAALSANAILREGAARIGFMTANPNIIQWDWDVASDTAECSTAGRRLLGIAAEEPFSFDRFLAAVHAADRVYVGRTLRGSLNDPGRADYHVVFRTAFDDGAPRWVEAFGSAAFDGAVPVRLAGIAFDISERRKEKITLQASEARHRSLLQATSAVTWTCPPDGIHVTPQPDWMAFTGQSASEMLGWGWSSSVHPDDLEDATVKWNACLSAGVPYTAETRHRRHDGEWRWMAVSAVPLRDPGGDIVEWFGMHIDITSRKELELRLEGALDAANAASDAKSAFVANMSHELRTPMNGVIGMLEVLLRTDLSDEQRDHVATSLRSARDLTHVLNDVLDIAAVEAGKVSIDRRPVDVKALLQEKLALFRIPGEAKGLAMEAVICRGFPDWVLADVRRLRQLLNNLVGNALKYTEQGRIVLRAAYDHDQGILRLEVSDSGIGMSDQVQANLFQRFYQADSRVSRRFGGSGLGLAICRHLVELMDGRIGVVSKEREGSTFWFEIPAPECDAPADGIMPEMSASDFRSMRVLVVEDNPTAQRIARSLLEAFGHEVTVVGDGAPAVAAAASGKFDVILMDVMMPGMDGVTATRKIRELGGRAGGVPIIALTADALFGKDEKYLAAGMTDYLAKPIEVTLLAAALRRADEAVDSSAAPRVDDLTND